MSKLQEAVERLRSAVNVDSIDQSAYGARWRTDPRVQRDSAIVAGAYLAEHPADEDEPITEEWLISVGFRDDFWLSVEGSLGIQAYPNIGKLSLIHDDRQPYSGDIYDYDIPGSTRGDVRRLCSAMGIELKA